MPIITLEAGKMDKEQKETLIREFTKTAADVLKLPQQSIVVLLKENDPDNVGTGGQMLSKR